MTDFQPKPFGKYFLIEKLATGGMAEIYKAKTFGVDGFEKLLAIKRILPHCSSDKEFINMLIDEAKLSVLLSHTNIVQVFDLGKVGSDYFISMEFVDGVNLKDVVQRARELGEKLPEEIIVYIISEMCKGLDYAHSKRDAQGNPLHIVHRDISPQNILLSYEGEVKIVDFGIAKAAMNVSQTSAGILKGKITYMSPEQALGKPVDDKTDIFSAGVVLYELLTNQKLFTGETQFEVLKKIRSTRISEENFPPSISEALKKILSKALAYQARDRFQNAGDMHVELNKYLYGNYLDFSPRKLAGLVKRLFAQELEHKRIEQRDELAIDAQTRSILLDAEKQQNLVHRDENEQTAVEQRQTQTQIQGGKDRSRPQSGQGRASQSPAPRSRMPAYLFALVLAAGMAFLLYKYVLKPGPTPQGEKVGIVYVTSTPPGAKILLNDRDTQLVTPATLEHLELNLSQKITLKKEKFQEWTRLVTLTSSQPLSLDVPLEVIPTGTVVVSTSPSEAKIFLNGEDTKLVSPAEIKNLELYKSYTLRFEKPDYRPLEEKVTVSSAEPVKVEKKLEAIPYGSLEIRTNPPGAKIFLNNEPTNLTTPGKIEKLEVGKTITLLLSKERYRDVQKTIPITSEKLILISERMWSEEEIKKREEAERKKREEEEKRRLEALKRNPTPGPVPTSNPNTDPTPKPTPLVLKTPKPTREPDPGHNTGPAYITVNSNPGGADVFIDGVQRGKAGGRFEVPSGRAVEIIIKKSGGGQVSKTVHLKPGETRSLGTVDLGGGELGVVLVQSTPEGAMVLLNGKPTGGKTPVYVRGVRRGQSHTITIQLNGYEPWSRSFTMDEAKKSILATLKEK